MFELLAGGETSRKDSSFRTVVNHEVEARVHGHSPRSHPNHGFIVLKTRDIYRPYRLLFKAYLGHFNDSLKIKRVV